MNRENHDPCTLATTCNICPKTKHQYCLCQISYSRSLTVCVCFVDSCLSFCTFSFGHYVVCSSSIYGLQNWFLIWWLFIILNVESLYGCGNTMQLLHSKCAALIFSFTYHYMLILFKYKGNIYIPLPKYFNCKLATIIRHNAMCDTRRHMIMWQGPKRKLTIYLINIQSQPYVNGQDRQVTTC